MEKEINKDKIKKSRKETEEKLKEDGAKRVTNRDEKGRFEKGSRLEVTPTQIENAKKEMEKSLQSLKATMEENKRKIEELEKEYVEKGYPDKIEERILKLESKIKDQEKQERLKEITERKEKLIKDLEALEEEVDPKGIKIRSDEEIEEDYLEKEKEIKKIEKEKEELLNEIEEQYEDKKETKKKKEGKLKTAKEIALEDLENIDEIIKEEEEEKTNKDKEKEEEEESGEEEEIIKSLAQKIATGKGMFTDQEMEMRIKLQTENPEKLNEAIKRALEEESEEKEKGGGDEEKKEQKGEEKVEGLPEDLVEHLNKYTFEETNKSILQRGWKKSRNLMGAVGGALGLKKLATTVPGVSQFIKSAGTAGAMTGGAIAGVGLKLGSYALEKWDETKKHKNFKENISAEIESSERTTTEVIENRMADLNTNMGIVKERLNQLTREKEELKEKGVWFFQKERREINAEIKKHKKALEKAEDQFRYLSVELKEQEEEVDIEELAEELIKIKKEQLKEKIEAGGPHASLLKVMLVSLKGTENIPGSAIKEKANLMKNIENAETGLMAKLEQENRSMAKEILFSAGLVAAFAGVADYVIELEPVQEKMEDISDWVSEKISNIKGEPSSSEINEFEAMLEKLQITTEENSLEFIDEIAEKEASYSIEAGDNIWSVTEEFLNDNLGKEFSSLSEAEQTYVIDHISTTIESNPQSFGLEFAEEETIDHLFTGGRHNIDFSPLLDGELELAFQKAESLSTEEIANILENNEIIREFLRDHKNVKITGETIESILDGVEVADLTEEEIADELILDSLKSDSISSAEQLQNIENWLEDMHNGELNEASFDFMADTAEGGKRELWIKQLAKVEGVPYEEMEAMIDDSYAEIIEETAGESIEGSMTMNELVDQMTHPEMDPFLDELGDILEINTEKPADVTDAILNREVTINEYAEALEEMGVEVENNYLEKLEINVQEYNMYEEEGFNELRSDIRRRTTEAIRSDIDSFSELETTQTAAESTVESGVYTQEGSLDIMDQMEFFENFSESFGVEADVTSDIVDAIVTGEVTPEEFVSWLESGDAFGKEIVFDGAENPPREAIKKELGMLIRDFSEAASKEGRRKTLELEGARKSGRSIIQSIMLYGK